MRETPASVTQVRVLALLGLPAADTYVVAARTLENRNLPGDGCPAGMTWQAVKKLTDGELKVALENRADDLDAAEVNDALVDDLVAWR